MPRKGNAARDLGGPARLDPWAPGRHGKFLVTASGAFHHWRTEADLAPHHAVAADLLGVSGWIIDGLIGLDGALEPTAMIPGTDIAAVLAAVAPQYEPLGIHRQPKITQPSNATYARAAPTIPPRPTRGAEDLPTVRPRPRRSPETGEHLDEKN